MNPVKLFVISANELDLRNAIINNDMENRTCAVLSSGRDAYDKFNIDTMVKVSVTSTESSSQETVFDNQCAFRILNKRLVNVKTESGLRLMSQLVIDGNIDISFIDSLNNVNIYSYQDSRKETYRYERQRPVVKLKQLHQQCAVYTIRAKTDAQEKSVRYYGNEYHTIVSSFTYMDKQLLFGSYFDDSYSMKVYDYDP